MTKFIYLFRSNPTTYMLVDAEDLDQAVESAKGCPVLESDGTVEIRPFVSM